MRSFAKEVGITPGGLSGILNGRSKILSGMFLKILEYRFNINPVWLETGEGDTYLKKFHIEDRNEIDLILKYRNLSRDQKKSIDLMTDALYQQIHHEDLVAETRRKKTKLWP